MDGRSVGRPVVPAGLWELEDVAESLSGAGWSGPGLMRNPDTGHGML